MESDDPETQAAPSQGGVVNLCPRLYALSMTCGPGCLFIGLYSLARPTLHEQVHELLNYMGEEFVA